MAICIRLKNDPPKDIHVLIPVTWECYLLRQNTHTHTHTKEGWGLEDVNKLKILRWKVYTHT